MSRNLEMKFKKLKPHQMLNKPDPNVLELESDIVHKYSSIHIHGGCRLTVKPWLGRTNYKIQRNERIDRKSEMDPNTLDAIIKIWSEHIVTTYSIDIQQLILSYISSAYSRFIGGRLLIKCKGDVIIEKGGKIEVDCCGYTSGTYYQQGESCNDVGKVSDRTANIGGGGAGLADYGGGGAGYATKGGFGYIPDNKMGDDIKEEKQYGLGGEIYGDKYLSTLHLGSGGGGSQCNSGGDGGGAISIECNKLINYGSITANGGDAMVGAGAGSGGSIHLIVHETIKMDQDSLIQAKGGFGGKWGLYGNGGHGRIRIDIDKRWHAQIRDIIGLKRINPPPFVYEK